MNARDSAQSDWESEADDGGHRYTYVGLLGDEWVLVSADPARDWRQYKLQFDRWKRSSSIGDYWQTNLIPPPHNWISSGWAAQSLFTQDIYQHEYSQSTHFDAGASGGWGLWSFNGSYSHDTVHQHSNSKTTAIQMEFEYLVVTIDRPWLQQDILDRSDWCWKQNVASNLLLSDGGNVPVARRLHLLALCRCSLPICSLCVTLS